MFKYKPNECYFYVNTTSLDDEKDFTQITITSVDFFDKKGYLDEDFVQESVYLPDGVKEVIPAMFESDLSVSEAKHKMLELGFQRSAAFDDYCRTFEEE